MILRKVLTKRPQVKIMEVALVQSVRRLLPLALALRGMWPPLVLRQVREILPLLRSEQGP